MNTREARKIFEILIILMKNCSFISKIQRKFTEKYKIMIEN